MSLFLDPEADEFLEQLHRTSPAVAGRVERLLDLIEADPGAAAVRRRQIRPVGLWLLTVPGDGDGDLAILWEVDDDHPVIRYLGPASFT